MRPHPPGVGGSVRQRRRGVELAGVARAIVRVVAVVPDRAALARIDLHLVPVHSGPLHRLPDIGGGGVGDRATRRYQRRGRRRAVATSTVSIVISAAGVDREAAGRAPRTPPAVVVRPHPPGVGGSVRQRRRGVELAGVARAIVRVVAVVPDRAALARIDLHLVPVHSGPLHRLPDIGGGGVGDRAARRHQRRDRRCVDPVAAITAALVRRIDELQPVGVVLPDPPGNRRGQTGGQAGRIDVRVHQGAGIGAVQ